MKFTLDGYKLKGSWVLVRTGGGCGTAADGGRSWLLIKHKDEWAGDVDIAEFAPRSVKSDGDFEDILAADNPDVWVSNRPAKGGETGAMLAAIIKKAAALKAQRVGRGVQPETPAQPQSQRRSPPRRPQPSRARRKNRGSEDTRTKAARKRTFRHPDIHHEQD